MGYIVRLSIAVQEICREKSERFDVYLVFDRHQDLSIKSATRANHGHLSISNCQMQ